MLTTKKTRIVIKSILKTRDPGDEIENEVTNSETFQTTNLNFYIIKLSCVVELHKNLKYIIKKDGVFIRFFRKVASNLKNGKSKKNSISNGLFLANQQNEIAGSAARNFSKSDLLYAKFSKLKQLWPYLQLRVTHVLTCLYFSKTVTKNRNFFNF